MLTISSATLAHAQSIALAKLLDLLQTSTSEPTIRQVAATILRFTTQRLAAAAKDAAKAAVQPVLRKALAKAPLATQPRTSTPSPPLLTPAEHEQLCVDFPFVRQYPELPVTDPDAWAQLVMEWKQHRAEIKHSATRANAPPQAASPP